MIVILTNPQTSKESIACYSKVGKPEFSADGAEPLQNKAKE